METIGLAIKMLIYIGLESFVIVSLGAVLALTVYQLVAQVVRNARMSRQAEAAKGAVKGYPSESVVKG